MQTTTKCDKIVSTDLGALLVIIALLPVGVMMWAGLLLGVARVLLTVFGVLTGEASIPKY